MSKLSDKEKRILTYIITNCEIYHFNEEESLKYIKEHFPRTISRRTYYNYKNQMYKNHEQKSPYFGLLRMQQGSRQLKNWISLSLLFKRNDMIEEGLKNDIKLDEFDKVDNLPQYFKKLYDRTGTVIEHSRNFLERLESKKQIVNENYKSISDNAMIREEYVNCGKESCFRCNHGPYYYAYWKDENGKLKKRYIGRNNPREQGTKENYNSDLENILSNRE
jgi:hypothetical protein